jgi:hypothetical protein
MVRFPAISARVTNPIPKVHRRLRLKENKSLATM